MSIVTEVAALEVQEIFGQFGVLVGGEVKLFGTDEEAKAFAAVKGSEEASYQRAVVYVEGLGLEVDSRNAQGKINQITAFLAYEAKGCPAFVPADDNLEKPDDAPALEV